MQSGCGWPERGGEAERAQVEAGVVVVVSTEQALKLELEQLGPAAERATLAASALALARRLDRDDTADTAVPALARELREALAVLRVQAEPEAEDRMTAHERNLRAVS